MFSLAKILTQIMFQRIVTFELNIGELSFEFFFGGGGTIDRIRPLRF